MRVLTGMQASGSSHLGNYLGMMRPMIERQNAGKDEMFFMVADLHAFVSKPAPEQFRENQKNLVLDWLATGIDVEKSVFFRQSDVSAHTELAWYLFCQTPMGVLERAHSYKDKKQNGIAATAGLFTYPVLMTADILLYDVDKVPVGKDQKQHVEIARDLAQKFNHEYGDTFVLPEPEISETVQTVPGLDGRKMSKSYGNTIEIFAEEKVFKKKIMSIKTESVALGESLDPASCLVFQLHEAFENPDLDTLREQYVNGEIGFGDSKKQLFEFLWKYFAEARKLRKQFEQDPELVKKVLKDGAEQAGEIAKKRLKTARERLGLS